MVTNVLSHAVYYGRHYGIRTIWTIYYLLWSCVLLVRCVLSYPVRFPTTPATHTKHITFSDRAVCADIYSPLHPFPTHPSSLYTHHVPSPHHLIMSSSSSKPEVCTCSCMFIIMCVMTIPTNARLALLYIYSLL